MNYLMYHPTTAPSGEALAEVLDIPHGSDPPDERPDYLIRWGTARGARFRPSRGVINSQKAINNSSNKLRALTLMRDARVCIPGFSRNAVDLEAPMLARSEHGMQGRDIVVIMQQRDIEQLEGETEFFVRYIPKRFEYRVHIIGGRSVKISEKIPTEGYDPFVWNLENGFTFRQPQNNPHPSVSTQAAAAVHALGLNFGAVDVIMGENDSAYVLEVNTAPRLGTENTLQIYADEIGRLIEDRRN